MKRILVSMPWMNDEYKAQISAIVGENPVLYKTPLEVTDEDVANSDVIIGSVPPSVLHEPELEFLQLTSAGADAYMPEGILKRSTVLSCCTGAYSQTVAEHALATTLMLQKDLHLYRDSQAACKWQPGGTTSSMDGATVIVMGLGDIGRFYARQAKALGAYVIGVKRTLSDKPDCVDELVTTDRFDEVVGRGDVILSVMPSTPQTIHFYTRERFEKMKKSAIFVNCGRGTAVSCEVLYDVLSNHLIRGAAVDVFEVEPLPEDSPLWKLPNLILTPHASGSFHLPATLTRVMDICLGNLKAWLDGTEVRNVVDYNTGYKKK